MSLKAHRPADVTLRRKNLATTLMFCVVGLACTEPMPIRVSSGAGFGEEVFRLWCLREVRGAYEGSAALTSRDRHWVRVCRGDVDVDAAAYPPSPRVTLLLSQRSVVITAIDQLVETEAATRGLRGLTRQLLVINDQQHEILDGMAAQAANWLADLSDSTSGLTSVTRAMNGGGLSPENAMTALASGFANAELPDGWTTALANVLANNAELVGRLPFDVAQLPTVNFPMLRSAMNTPSGLAGVTPISSAVLDERGIARLVSIRTPFRDLTGDGLADLDSDGRFLLDGYVGGPVVPYLPWHQRASTPFAVSGGRLTYGDSNEPVFEERDLSLTAGATLVQLLTDVVARQPGLTLSAASGLSITDRQSTARTVNAGFGVLAAPTLVQVLQLVAGVLETSSGTFANAVGTILDSDFNSESDQGEALGHEFTDLLEEFAANPEFTSALLHVLLNEPRSNEALSHFATMMQFSDNLTFGPGADPNLAPTGLPLDELVDRSRADVRGNDSLFERSLAMLDGLDGLRVCNRAGAVLRIDLGPVNVRWPLTGSYDECELFNIPNIAEAYAMAMLGRFELPIEASGAQFLLNTADTLGIDVDRMLERSSGINGMARFPSAQALNRLLFWGADRSSGTPNSRFVGDLIDVVRDRHGNDVIETYGGTVFAWEAVGLYEAMVPILEVFQEPRFRVNQSGQWRFGQVFRFLYRFWPTADHWLSQTTDSFAPNYSRGANLRSVEPGLIDFLVTRRGLGAVQELYRALDASPRPSDSFAQLLSELIADQPSLPPVTGADGRPRRPTRLRRMMEALLLAPEAAENTELSTWIASFLRLEEGVTSWRFGSDRTPAQLAQVIRALAASLEQRTETALTAEGQSVSSLMTSDAAVHGLELLAALDASTERTTLANLVGRLAQQTEVRRVLVRVLHQLLAPQFAANDEPAWWSGLVATVSHDSTTPHWLSGLLQQAPTLFEGVSGDDVQAVARSLGNSWQPNQTDTGPLSVLLEVVFELNRQNVGNFQQWTSADAQALSTNFAAFVGDDDHGLGQLLELLEARRLR